MFLYHVFLLSISGGSIWKPPPLNFYTQGMPEELLNEDDLGEPNKGALSTA